MADQPPTRRERLAHLTRESIDMGTYDMPADQTPIPADHAHTYGMPCPVDGCRWPMPVAADAPISAEVYDVACRAWEAAPAGSPDRLIAAVDAAYRAGLAAGRTAAAADIRAEVDSTRAIEGGPDLMRWAAEIAERVAARIAENGTDPR